MSEIISLYDKICSYRNADRVLMVTISIVFSILLIVSASGQMSGTTSCWMCPVCETVYPLEISVPDGAQYYQTTLGSITSLDPNNPDWYCPACYYMLGTLTFAGTFVLVPCTDLTEPEYDTDGDCSGSDAQQLSADLVASAERGK